VAGDSNGYDHNGAIETLDDDVLWVSGRNDGKSALEFSGGRVRVSDAAALRPEHQVSVCAWVNYSEEQNHSARIVVKGADNKETFGLEIDDDDGLTFHLRDANEPEENRYPADSDDELEHDEWIHIAGTYDGNTVRCYINGEVAGTNDDANAISQLCQDTNDLAIGNRSDADNREFIGTIDDVRVYNYGLSEEEIGYIATDGTKIFSVQSVANLYNKEKLGERAVNLRDYAELAKSWLEKKLWPE